MIKENKKENEILIDITKASEILGVHKRTLMNWDRSKKLIALRTFGGHRRYKLSQINYLINKGFKK